MINQQGRLIREVAGPKPHSLALRALNPKPNAAKKEILAWRAQEKIRTDAALYVKSHRFGQWMNELEQQSKCRWMKLSAKKKVDAEMQAYLAGEEEKRERLRDLLEAEEKCYLTEMESMHETMEDRQKQMRARAKLLRDKREEANRKVVAEKREQQFRGSERAEVTAQLPEIIPISPSLIIPVASTSLSMSTQRESCQEVRAQGSKKLLLEVCEDRLAQLALKDELKKQKAMEEATFAALWEEDRLAKERREECEARKRSMQNRDSLSVLNAQRTCAEAQKEEEKRLKAEEAKIMEEERELMKLEKRRAELERKRKMMDCRDMLLDSMKEKMKRYNEAKQEEEALNMKILENAMKETQEDTEGQRRRKKELFKEQQTYRAHLAQQKEEEKRMEKEMEKLRGEELERMWARRSENERAMKLARNRLMKEVLDTRRLQIEERKQKNILDQESLMRDKDLLNAAMQEYKRLEDEKFERRTRQAKEYKNDLKCQMDHLKQANNKAKEEEAREYAAALEAERVFQQKMADVLNRPYMKMRNLHPLRRQLATSF